MSRFVPRSKRYAPSRLLAVDLLAEAERLLAANQQDHPQLSEEIRDALAAVQVAREKLVDLRVSYFPGWQDQRPPSA